MDTIIGLGQAGCNIADHFAKYPQYEIYKIDTHLEQEEKCFSATEYDHPEKYEENCPNFTDFFKDISGDVLFIVGGSGYISGMALRVLQQLKEKAKINILYLRPDPALLSDIKKRQEWLTYNVLQEYTRSGVFEKIYLVENSAIEDILGEVPIIGYYKTLNHMIVSVIHMVNVYDHIDAVVDTFSDPVPSARICTFGLVKPQNKEQKLFFPLDNIRDLRYYYAINKDKLSSSGSLLKSIKEEIKERVRWDKNKKATYGIFSTKYNEDYLYVIAHSSAIQN